MKPIEIDPVAKIEFDDAYDYYQSQRIGLGEDFAREVLQAFKRISPNPRVHGFAYKDVRKARVKVYPYCIYYKDEPHQVLVISIFHTSRDPAEWQRRV